MLDLDLVDERNGGDKISVVTHHTEAAVLFNYLSVILRNLFMLKKGHV